MARLKSRIVTLFALSMLVGAGLAIATPAAATNWSGATGATGCTAVNKADSPAHGFYYLNLTSSNATAMNWARTNVLDPTDINTYYDTYTSITDVVVMDNYWTSADCGFSWWTNPVAGGVVGAAVCKSLSGSSCEQFWLYMNQYWTDASANDWVQAMAAHEAGHTIGLLHRTSGTTVMQSGYPKPSRYFDTHDTNHVNSNY